MGYDTIFEKENTWDWESKQEGIWQTNNSDWDCQGRIPKERAQQLEHEKLVEIN